ncbi:MAG: FAD-dependent oxidoreductase [Gammaproteobacteria bacterium]|nr:FAD-dependent oxidoreductase [Gammaproteobacteria bacterium]
MNIVDVAIIGGGLHGCSAALHLAQLGARVVLLEQNTLGQHASGVNAGGVRTLNRHITEVPLALQAQSMWHKIEQLVDDDCGFRASSQLRLALDKEGVVALQQRHRQLRALGYDHEQWLDAAQVREQVPEVNPACRGGLMVAADGHADPVRTVTAFAHKLQQLKVDVRQRTAVTNLRQRQGQWQIQAGTERILAARVLNCGGAWGDRIANWMGDQLALQARAPMLMVTASIAHFLRPVIGIEGRMLSFKQRSNGTVLVGGGYLGKADRQVGRAQLNCSGLRSSARTVLEVFPAMAGVNIIRAWAGLEGYTPDQLPYLGRGRQQGAFHAFGFSAHGFQLAPFVGKIMAEMILGENDHRSLLQPFTPDRLRLGD